MARRTKWPTGITERQLANGTRRFQLAFSFRGKPIRKLTTLEVSRTNATYLSRLRATIYMEMEQGIFRFGKYWPDSKEAKLYDTTQIATDSITAALTHYIEDARANKLLEVNSLRSTQTIIDKVLIPTFGHLRLCDLSPRDIERWISLSGLSQATIQSYLRPLSAIYRRAVRYGELDRSPLDKIAIAELLPKKKRASHKEDVDPFSLEEIQTLIDVAPNWAKHLIPFSCFTGLRPSELIALQWEDIDFERRTAHIQRARDLEGGLKLPKTDKTRVIELRGPALNALAEQQALTRLQGPWVWLNGQNKPWTSAIHFGEWWRRRFFPKEQIRYRPPYQMRHTFASQMLSRGESLIWVAHMLGHANFTMLEKVYHQFLPEPDDKFETINDWSDALESAKKRT